MSPGGIDSVQLGGPIASPTVDTLLAKPSPGGLDSIDFSRTPSDLPVISLITRFPPGGKDSIEFGKAEESIPATDLLSRPAPGGKATVLLGGDDVDWSTNSQVLGTGSAQACADMESRPRPAPGGADNVELAADVKNLSVEALLARASVGGRDSVDFTSQPTSQTSAEELLTRPRVGGNSTVVLGSDGGEWTRDSQAVGVGSSAAVEAMESVPRPVPGGADSIDFGETSVALSKEELLARPAVGGQTVVVLGGDKPKWTTDSDTIGTGSYAAASKAQLKAPVPPGGIDSVNGITDAISSASVEELLLRPATGGGGKTTVILGGDSADWTTSSDNCKVPSGYVAESVPRQAPGGVDSVDFAASPTDLPTAEALLTKPAVGGRDSVEFGKGHEHIVSSTELLARPFPGGRDKVVLGDDTGDWVTSCQSHSKNVFDGDSNIGVVRPPPGGVDSVVMAGVESCLSAEELLARPAVGGCATVVLGEDKSKWSACSAILGEGCADAAGQFVVVTAQTAVGAADSINFTHGSGVRTPAKTMRTMNPAAAASRLNLEDKSFTPTPGVSSNRFASGSNQNAGNVLTDRPTTRLHQAPGGNSTLSLGDLSASPAVGESAKKQKSKDVLQPPGGTATIYLGDEKFQGKNIQDENVNRVNLQKATQDAVKVTQAPGGNSALVLG
jgi:hypothetical protein